MRQRGRLAGGSEEEDVAEVPPSEPLPPPAAASEATSRAVRPLLASGEDGGLLSTVIRSLLVCAYCFW